MDDLLKIYVDRLKSGQNEKINTELGADFLDIHDEDLSFPESIQVTGETYTAEDDLIIHLNATTVAVLPCVMCNEPVKVSLNVSDFYHVEPMHDIKDGFFDYGALLREAIVMEAPAYIECHQGKCPHREELKKFSKHANDSTFPFSNL
jgi:uncharacterized metal-binding protein YceD (DUF177 family)